MSGFRPFWVQNFSAQGDFRSGTFLYPLFTYTVDDTIAQWNVFQLIKHSSRRPGAEAPQSDYDPRRSFEIWPFWFSKENGNPQLSYRALFPIAGTVRNKLGLERLSWTLFPLRAESENNGAVTTWTPWPFVRITRGAAQGFSLWPLFGSTERPGVSREKYYLWPLGYNNTQSPTEDDPPDAPERQQVGVLPFYARSTGPGYRSEDFGWPFFGYTERTTPKPYHETRYFWPLFVQGRGEGSYVNRWGPFYTRSVIKGYDKEWFAWPLLSHARWNEQGLAVERTQGFYFVYWSEVQRNAAQPGLPAAELTHFWPLFSHWDNGAGQRQWQLFSPFEAPFPGNLRMRQAWTPLFAIARHEQRAPGDSRTSLLWNAVTWSEYAPDHRTEFHIGPLLSVTERAGEKRVAVGNGLFGFKRATTGSWRIFWLDFPSKPATGMTARR